MSDTFVLTNETKEIVYGDRETKGQIAYDNVLAFASEELIIRDFPFLKVDEKYEKDDLFSGIIGMSPKDDSAGPLFIDYLY